MQLEDEEKRKKNHVNPDDQSIATIIMFSFKRQYQKLLIKVLSKRERKAKENHIV